MSLREVLVYTGLYASYHSFADFALSLKMPINEAFLLFKNVSLREKKALPHNKATPLAR